MDNELTTRVLSDYMSGLSLNKLSKKYSIPKTTLYYCLHKLGSIRKKQPVTKLCSEDKLLIGIFMGVWAGDGSRYLDRKQKMAKIHLNKKRHIQIRFILYVLSKLFGKKFSVNDDGGNKASIRIFSAYVFSLFESYLYFRKNKSHTIDLKNDFHSYGDQFLKGFLLGLAITDGYLKEMFVLNTVSKKLSVTLQRILEHCGFIVYSYANQNAVRSTLYRIYTSRSTVSEFKEFLTSILNECGWKEDISTTMYSETVYKP